MVYLLWQKITADTTATLTTMQRRTSMENCKTSGRAFFLIERLFSVLQQRLERRKQKKSRSSSEKARKY